MTQLLLVVSSIIIVGCGQPAWHWIPSVLASALGYALFFRVLLSCSSRKRRFFLGLAWFSAVQMIQLSWMIAHPFAYIVVIWILFSMIIGTQFGVFSLFLTPPQLTKVSRIVALAGLWTLIEWSRLFFLSGYTWNPVGLALSAHLHSMQLAAIWGVYGLSFWVILVNLFAIRAWVYGFAPTKCFIWLILFMLPFAYGTLHLNIHRPALAKYQAELEDPYHIVLVQTAFPVEEALGFWGTKNMVIFVVDEWKQILNITAQHYGKDVDMIALPEFVVPFGTWTYVYPYDKVEKAFAEILGPETVELLPPLSAPFARRGRMGGDDDKWYVNNAFWLQAMANIFNSDVVAGLEDAEQLSPERKVYYSAALHFQPHEATDAMIADGYLDFQVNRYEKRVLVPMGEYIPFSFLNELAREYGVFGSFTHGKEAKKFPHSKVPFGIAICYEETFGDLMREARQLGAEMIINVTSDAWFPNSLLPRQHFDHARLRSVESGIPLVRACNTGVTSGVDSLGQVVAMLGETPHEQEWSADSIYFELPTYTYHTLYSRVGDGLIIGFSFMAALLSLRFRDYHF